MLRVGITGIPMVCGAVINGNVTRNAQVFFGTWQQMDSQAVVIE